jgi:hypothetical protein
MRLNASHKYTAPNGLFLLKGILALGSLGYLAFMITTFPYSNWPKVQWSYMALLLLLAPANWSLEILKWRSLSPASIPLPFQVWVKVFLAGMAAALFSPNRTGESIGRILSLPPQLRWPLGTSALLGSLAQLCVTLIGGVLAWEYWVPNSVFPAYLMPFRWAMRLIGLCLLLFFLFRIPMALRRFYRYAPKALKSQLKHASKGIRQKNWLQGLGWAFARYLVFLLQWWIGLQALGIGLPFTVVLPAVAFIFFGNALLPSFAFTELASRGSLSILFLGNLGIAPGLALLVSSVLWVVNLALPALPGFFFLLKNTPKK